MVFDRDAEADREVDILIEYKVAGHSIKIAIECRDRSRKATVEWIDSLLGKTKSLDVNKIVAVSKKGFTETARTKATSYGIDTLTLEEANEKDWESYLFKPGIVLRTPERFTLIKVLYWSGNEYLKLSQLGINSTVEYQGQPIGTVKQLVEMLFQDFLVPIMSTYIKENFFSIFKNLADLKKAMLIEKEQEITPVIISSPGCEPLEVSKVKFVVLGTRETQTVEQHHTIFNDKMLSVGEHLEKEGSLLKFKLLQDPETMTLHVNWVRE